MTQPPLRESAGDVQPPPRPVVKKMRWPFPLVWFVPVIAAIIAGYYYQQHLRDHGPDIVLQFDDASGLKANQTQVLHRGVSVGRITKIELSADQAHALVHVRLERAAASLARGDTYFWIVRPEISGLSISGLGTVVSGPYIEAVPGGGKPASEFTGFDRPPLVAGDGLVLILHADHLEHLAPDAPVTYRGIQVGAIQAAQLGYDATGVDVYLVVWPRFKSLVHTDSVFWNVGGFDLSGSLFTGVKAKLNSLSALVSGGIAFATPDTGPGAPAQTGAEFLLNAEPKKEWLKWAPKIPIEPDIAIQSLQSKNARQEVQAMKSSLESK